MPIYSQLGRLDEAERLIEARWEHLNKTGEGASERAIDLVRLHLELTFKASPVENDRTYLDGTEFKIWGIRGGNALMTPAVTQRFVAQFDNMAAHGINGFIVTIMGTNRT